MRESFVDNSFGTTSLLDYFWNWKRNLLLVENKNNDEDDNDEEEDDDDDEDDEDAFFG